MTLIPPPPRTPSFGARPASRAMVLALALIPVCGTIAVEVVRAWRAEPPPPPPVTAIEWEAAERQLNRIEAATAAETKLRDDQVKEIRASVERIENALDRLTGGPNRTRMSR